MSVIALIGRILLGVIEQPGVQDFMTDIARRAVRQSTVAVVKAIQNRTRLRKTQETFQ